VNLQPARLPGRRPSRMHQLRSWVQGIAVLTGIRGGEGMGRSSSLPTIGFVSAFAVALACPPVFAQANPERNAYFGETHVHTSWSLDAWLGGDRITDPGDAYKYFKGEPIKHPLGYDVKIDTPLDWAGVTDHSEYVGVTKLANTPGSAISKEPAAQPLILKNESVAEAERVFVYVLDNLIGKPPVKA